MPADIGRIERRPLREVWPHEALDFTAWLELNIDLLNEYLPVPIDTDSVAREAAAGAFQVDLVAEDANGDTVVIENQLEKSNHDHLGKVVTYTAARSAKTAVWIVAEPRDEHIRAVSWLNDAGLAAFWLFKVEAIKIGDSLPAPLLTKIVGPAEDFPAGPLASGQDAARDRTRRAFFQRLLEQASELTNLHAGVKAGGHPWLGRAEGGINWVYGVRTSGTRVMLYIDRGAGHGAENDAIYEHLLSHRSEIEAAFGQSLQWEAKEGNRSRTIGIDLNLGGWADPDSWPDAIKPTVETMVAFEKAVRPYVKGAVEAANSLEELPTDEIESEAGAGAI